MAAATLALSRLDCPSLARRFPLPREAMPEQLDSPDWSQRKAQLDESLASVDRRNAGIVFVGDSITQSFDPNLWKQFYGHRVPVNLGLQGDFTQGALWRLSEGQWGEMRPKLAILLLGTNNTQWGSKPEDVALGIAEIVRFIHARSPSTKVLLLGLLPRGETSLEPLREVNARVNSLVSRCADGQITFFLDVGPLLLDATGNLSEQISFDRLHLTPIGYGILAAAIEPTVRRLMGE